MSFHLHLAPAESARPSASARPIRIVLATTMRSCAFALRRHLIGV